MSTSHSLTITPHFNRQRSDDPSGSRPNIPPSGPTSYPQTTHPHIPPSEPTSYLQTPHPHIAPSGPTNYLQTPHPHIAPIGPMTYPQTTHPHIPPSGPTNFLQTTHPHIAPSGPTNYLQTPHPHIAPIGPMSYPQTTYPHIVPSGPTSYPQTTHPHIDLTSPRFPPTALPDLPCIDPIILPTVKQTDITSTSSLHNTFPPTSPLRNTIQAYLSLQPQPNNQHIAIEIPQSQMHFVTTGFAQPGQAFSYSQLVTPHPQEVEEKIEIRERPHSPIKWMSETHLPLKDLPILGTNNSGFFMGQERAQRVDISEQLKLGVRLLDLAIVQYHDEIYLDQYKHIYDLCCPYITISEALLSIKFFLERNPNEVLYLNLRCRSDSEVTDKDQQMGKGSDPIDSELLEAKFDVIKKFFFNVKKINFEYNAKKLTASKRNIICFAKDLPCFHFLLKSGLSLHGEQVHREMINEYNISTLLNVNWTKQKADASVTNPYEKRFTWFVIDAVTADRDASVLKDKWEESNKDGKPVPFHFFSLCKVTQKTWTDFKDLILSKHPKGST